MIDDAAHADYSRCKGDEKGDRRTNRELIGPQEKVKASKNWDHDG